MKQEHIDTIGKLLDRCNVLRRDAKNIDTQADAAILAMYYWVPVSIGLTLFESGVRQRSALEDGLRYYFSNHYEKGGRPDTPQAALFKQFAFHRCRELTPSKAGPGAKGDKGNSRVLIEELDKHMGVNNSVAYGPSFMAQHAMNVERRHNKETEYRFRWGHGEFGNWIKRSSLQQTAATKAIKSLVEKAEEAENWL